MTTPTDPDGTVDTRPSIAGRVVVSALIFLLVLVFAGAMMNRHPVDTWADVTNAGVGAVHTTGAVDVTVQGVEAGIDHVGRDESGAGPQHGQFVKVTVQVANSGDVDAVFVGADPFLTDDQGRTHFVSPAASYLLGDELDDNVTIAAGESVTGILLYDLPADTTPVGLTIATGGGADPVQVALFS